ncbi:MAG: hypothetical protein ACPGU5_08940 [Lishizhenia sp.]
MKNLFYVLLLIGLFCLLFFSNIQIWLFGRGVSWYWSHIMPYLIATVCTVIGLSLLIFVKLERRFKIVLFSLFLTFPPTFFAIHPIYAGDFSDNSSKIIVKQLPSNLYDLKDGLTMISLANCEYCYEALKTLEFIKKRAQSTEVSVAVLTTNSAVIDYYNEETNNAFNIFMIDSAHLETWSELSPNQQFPCFLYLEDKKIVKKWSNQQFGYLAKDFVESGK